MQPKIHRKIATDIRAIRSHVIEVHERRRRYEVNLISVDKPIKVDPRALVLYEDMRKLVGIDEARDEVIKILIEGNEVSKVKDKIVSIVGFGGLGKTTLANVVYQKLKAQFDCSAFVSVSQTPDMDKLFKDMFHQLAKYKATSINVINELREFLQDKRYEYIKKTIHQFIICIFFFSKMVVVIKVKDLDLTRLTEFMAHFNTTQIYPLFFISYKSSILVGTVVLAFCHALSENTQKFMSFFFICHTISFNGFSRYV
jgi:ATPase subunit of ABC transporter with duplicated ATPase domains